MKVKLKHGDVETLLTPEARALLPFSHQLMLYLDPFAFFKDASLGNPGGARGRLALQPPEVLMLLTYIRRWLLIAAGSFLGIASSETLAGHLPLFDHSGGWIRHRLQRCAGFHRLDFRHLPPARLASDRLVVLSHSFFLSDLQQGQRGSRRASSPAIRYRSVGIESGTWRCALPASARLVIFG